MSELNNAKILMPFVTMVGFSDDCFLAQPTEKIVEFAKRYKEEINLPFRIIASPETINETKIDALIEAGLCAIQIGVGVYE